MLRSSLGRLGLLFVSLLGLMSLLSASASAAGQPIVTVGAASNLTLNTATLNGTVNPNGGAGTSYKFEYGKTKLYGKTTTSTSVGGGTTPVPASALVYGLEPLTTYHFRVCATNGFGTSCSEDMTFEMLLSWKVEGKYLSELSEAPLLQSEWGNEPIAIERMLGGKLAKVTCKGNVATKLVVLGQEYNLPFRQCKVFWGGIEQKTCTPPDITLHLNAFAEVTGNQRLVLSEMCPIGEEIPLAGGFSIGASAEQKTMTSTLTEITKSGGWTVNYGPVEWFLTGPFTNQKFGIS